MGVSPVSGAVLLGLFSIVWTVLFQFLGGSEFFRAYEASHTVATSYDSWTADGILEYYWGDHIHLGYYPHGRVIDEDFRAAKVEMTKRLFEWAMFNISTGSSETSGSPSRSSARGSASGMMPPGSRLLDAGCGFGGSTRQLVAGYGFAEGVGISLSGAQILRARELTTDNRVSFRQMDVLTDLSSVDAPSEVHSEGPKGARSSGYPDAHFDVVWSLEMEPHIPDKKRMLRELVRILKPGGTLVLGCWNVRSTSLEALTPFERDQVHRLLTVWAHPEFWSIQEYAVALEELGEQMEALGEGYGLSVRQDDWSVFAYPSWRESVWTIFRRPRGLLWALMNPLGWKERAQDLFGLWDMHDAFGRGLMQYGVFAITKKPVY